MKKNVGSVDKIVRIVLGLAIGAAGYYYQSWLGLIGIIPIATALINFCPVYTLLKLNTAEKTKE